MASTAENAADAMDAVEDDEFREEEAGGAGKMELAPGPVGLDCGLKTRTNGACEVSSSHKMMANENTSVFMEMGFTASSSGAI
jgi:hypothetical protein